MAKIGGDTRVKNIWLQPSGILGRRKKGRFGTSGKPGAHSKEKSVSSRNYP